MDKYPIILFDGICNLCNTFVQQIIRHDARRIFHFASQQSPVGRRLTAQFASGINPEVPESVVLIQDGKAYLRSDAALKIMSQLDFPCNLARAGFLFPKWMRDGVYRLIARNRYRWFGKRNSCMVPTPDLRARFVE